MSEKLPLRDEEPTLGLIRELRDAELLTEKLMARALKARRSARARVEATDERPRWDDLQIITAQLATKPRLEDTPVGTELVLGLATRKRPQRLENRLLVQFGRAARGVVRRLTIGEFGLQVLDDDDAGDEDSVRALCVDHSALRRHRERIRESEVPVGVRLNEDNVEHDLTEALVAGADFILLDAGGSTIRALTEARRFRDRTAVPEGFAVILGGDLRVPNDFIKALALGADGVTVASSTVDRILEMAGDQGSGGHQLVSHFIHNATTLMKVMTRACGHAHLKDLSLADLTTWHHHMATASGVTYSGHDPVE